ncbi:WD repeat-containing protein 13 [Tanacetum coccineum]
MTDQTIDNNNKNDKENEDIIKKDLLEDPETFSCVLQPNASSSDRNYVGIRRFLLFRKAQSGLLRRKDWRCNGKGYVAYRNFINRPDNWMNSQVPSRGSTPGTSGRWLSSPSQLSMALEMESWTGSRDLRDSQTLSRTVSLGANLSDIEQPGRKPEPAYSFVGMHCIFDECKSMVTVIKFGHMSSDILAYGATDGTITVCTVSDPPSVTNKFIGHSKDVTGNLNAENKFRKIRHENKNAFDATRLSLNKVQDFDFSLNNQYIASSSLDKTVRVWDIPNGLCIRVIYGVTSQLCIRFHPVNNNFLTVGNAKKEISVFNFSTGRLISKIVVDSAVPALDYDHTGQFIFCGDAQGSIYTVKVNPHQGTLSRTHRTKTSSKHKSEFTTIEYRTFSLMTQGPVLLSLTRDGNLSFFSVSLELQGYLTLRCSLKLAPRLHSIRASFCPLLSLEKGEYIVDNMSDYSLIQGFSVDCEVIGSEDAAVYFYDLTRPKNTCVNKLQGHGYPVIAVAWNHGENLLASSDFGGTKPNTRSGRCGSVETFESGSTFIASGPCREMSIAGDCRLMRSPDNQNTYIAKVEESYANNAIISRELVARAIGIMPRVVGGGRTYCKCEMPYNPDDLMVQCDGCSDWFHPACIDMNVDEAKRMEHFFCQSCLSDEPKITSHASSRHAVMKPFKSAILLLLTLHSYDYTNFRLTQSVFEGDAQL